jgi:small GTP-binding protein
MTIDSYSLKLVVLGRHSVGKTSIVTRYCENTYTGMTLPTMGVDVKTRNLTIGERSINLIVWDTAGSERFSSFTPAFWRGADGLVLVYDVAERQSFEDLDSNLTLFLSNTDFDPAAQPPVLLLGNKIDVRQRVVPPAAVAAWMAANRISMHREVSAKTGANVAEAFAELIASLMSSRGMQRRPAMHIAFPEERATPCC